jgi:2-dehydro-3-deoxyphosphogluconate aldolase / (4S)-4-hydroxy-2-oxoglutarate aldolase
VSGVTTAAPGMAREAVVARIRALGAVAVVRMKDARQAMKTVEAIHRGGVSAIELTVTTPGAIALIAQVVQSLGDEVLVGVGSVLDVETARRAVEAGARYVVSPVFDEQVVRVAHDLGVAAMPGAFTPTEILRAHRAGADVVKVFPSEVLGPAFLKGVLAPMPFLTLMPTGGVTPDNVGTWIRAGAVAVGVGGALMDPKLIAAEDWSGLTLLATRLADGVRQARAEMGA